MYDLLSEHVQQVDRVHAKAVRTIANAAFPHSSPGLDARMLETNLFSTDEQVNEKVGEQGY